MWLPISAIYKKKKFLFVSKPIPFISFSCLLRLAEISKLHFFENITHISHRISKCLYRYNITVMILIFRTDRIGQTVQNQTRLSSLIRVFTVCYSICVFLTKYATVWPFCLNFRLITAKFSGVRKFRNFTVGKIKTPHHANMYM